MFDGPGCDEQRSGDVGVGLARSDELEHLSFPPGAGPGHPCACSVVGPREQHSLPTLAAADEPASWRLALRAGQTVPAPPARHAPRCSPAGRDLLRTGSRARPRQRRQRPGPPVAAHRARPPCRGVRHPARQVGAATRSPRRGSRGRAGTQCPRPASSVHEPPRPVPPAMLLRLGRARQARRMRAGWCPARRHGRHPARTTRPHSRGLRGSSRSWWVVQSGPDGSRFTKDDDLAGHRSPSSVITELVEEDMEALLVGTSGCHLLHRNGVGDLRGPADDGPPALHPHNGARHSVGWLKVAAHTVVLPHLA